MTAAGATPTVRDRGTGPGGWDHGWAAERAAEALRYLAQRHPGCAGSSELHPHQDAAHRAAVDGDRDAYLEALRGYMRCGAKLAAATRARRNPVHNAGDNRGGTERATERSDGRATAAGRGPRTRPDRGAVAYVSNAHSGDRDRGHPAHEG